MTTYVPLTTRLVREPDVRPVLPDRLPNRYTAMLRDLRRRLDASGRDALDATLADHGIEITNG